ncbi:SDR family NAD(P)-dependent oxidoreductase, partial [Francisella tularensis subsp. holarctica]|nr:SDR family NAD(P)-dependent oxidoreductase [Francisella tularensis subsp. holarctica]
MANYLVTVGSKGIGKAVVELLLQNKNHTVINIDIQQSFSAENLKFIKADL